MTTKPERTHSTKGGIFIQQILDQDFAFGALALVNISGFLFVFVFFGFSFMFSFQTIYLFVGKRHDDHSLLSYLLSVITVAAFRILRLGP